MPRLSGFFTIVYSSGQFRTLRFRIIPDGPLQGKTVVAYKEMGDYVRCGFLRPDGGIQFWKSWRGQAGNDETRMQRIVSAVATILRDPAKHQLAFAMKEKCCSRCGRQLTVPASLYAGMGAECAGKTNNWTKADNQAAFEGMRAGASA